MKNARRRLEDFRAPVKLKLALLWASLMFLYIYNDYFSLYSPGTIEGMMAGRIGPLGEATEPKMIGVSLLLAVPALMIFLSAILAPWPNRLMNLLLGIGYTGIEVMTLIGSRLFYQIVVGLEIALTLAIVWHSLRWPTDSPREEASPKRMSS